MSLLLDALKKAADDKQKATENGLVEDAVSSPQAVHSADAEQVTANEKKTTATADVSEAQSEELVLQDIDDTEDVKDSTEKVIGEEVELTLDDITDNEPSIEAQQQAVVNEVKDERPGSGKAKYTVSDDALSLLIYKTNRDVKIGRRVALLAILAASFIILVSGGIYYYQDMQAEIAMLERKHQNAMRAMQSKTSKEKAPQQSEIIRNLVSESGLDEKVQYAKKQMASNNKAAKKNNAYKAKAAGYASASYASGPRLSIQKTNKSDPVGEKLEQAWLLYEDGEYSQAEALYVEVLKIEKNSRDAMLGIGAIAVIEKNNARARDVYMSLLEQDPRDPIATAALAGLRDDESTLKADEEYLLNMLSKNPDTPHLNFALGNNYAQQNKWQPAQQYYFNAWQFDNENADYIFNLAVSMDQLGKQQQAIDFYKDSLLKSENKQVSFSREAVNKRISELSGL